MAFALRNLSVLAYAQGFTLWHYKGPGGTLADATSQGFFNPAADMLTPGDMVILSATDGGRMLFVAATDHGVATAPLS